MDLVPLCPPNGLAVQRRREAPAAASASWAAGSYRDALPPERVAVVSNVRHLPLRCRRSYHQVIAWRDHCKNKSMSAEVAMACPTERSSK